MKKDWVKKIVRNAIHEVSVAFEVAIECNESPMEFDRSVEFDFTPFKGRKRGVTVRDDGRGNYTTSHGFHSPADMKSDLLQQAICGRIAERLLTENLK